MPPVFGDFRAAARDRIEPAPAAAGAGDLLRLVEVIARYADDIAPSSMVEAETWPDLSGQEHGLAGAAEALHLAAEYLNRIPSRFRVPAPDGQSALASAAAILTAGRDLLHTHLETGPDGLRAGRTEWAAVLTSAPVTRALAAEVAWWAERLAEAVPAASAGQAGPDRCLAAAARWLLTAAASARQSVRADPLRPADTELLDAVPASGLAPRLPPGPGETVTGLCEGIIVSSARFRAAVRRRAMAAQWSPAVNSGDWRWTVLMAKSVSQTAELTLRSLSGTAPRLDAALRDAAAALAGMQAGWDRVHRAWHAVVTETRGLPSPTAAMIEGSDLLLRVGRLTWDNPQWEPARHRAGTRFNPALATADAGTVTAVVSAVHHAADALAFAASADAAGAQAAARAGRLYVPTRSLPESRNVPRAYAAAPADAVAGLQDAYGAAGRASLRAAQSLDVLAAETGSPSRILALVRAALPAQARRRIPRTPSGRPGPAEHNLAFPGRLEQAVRTLGTRDPGIELRAAAIDRAARGLIQEALQATAPAPVPKLGTAAGRDRQRHAAAAQRRQHRAGPRAV